MADFQDTKVTDFKPKWVKDGENGFIVPQDDPQALAERLVYLVEDKELRERFGREGRSTIVARAEYEKEMGRVEKLYEEMIGAWKFSRNKSGA